MTSSAQLRVLFLLVCSLFANVVLGSRGPALKPRDTFAPARVPYVLPPPGTDPAADAIRARRNGTLLALDGVLLNAELISASWNDIATVIRDNNSIPADMRELMILRAGALNKAAYQWLQHEPVGRAAGLTTEQLLLIRLAPPFFNTAKSSLSPEQSAAMLFADHVTKSISVPDSVYNGLKKHLNDRQIVEATATVGFYNFVSRFLIALNVDGDMNMPVPIPK